jgi:hypothetical protein
MEKKSAKYKKYKVQADVVASSSKLYGTEVDKSG